MLSEVEIRAIAKTIVDKAKRTAKVDQGSLKRSIAYTYVRNEVIFRELYYGQWNDNSQLEEYATQLMPNGVKWKIIYTILGGDTYEVGKTRQGRTTQKKAVATALRNSSKNIKNLIALLRSNRKKDEESDKK